MIELLKACVYASTASILGLIVFGVCIDRSFGRTMLPRLMILTVILQAASFLAPSLLVFDLAGVLVVPVFAAERRQIAPVYLYALLTIPLVVAPLAAAGIYLTNYDIGISIGLGAVITLLVRSKGRSKRSLLADFAVLLLAGLITAATARSTSLTNIGRIVTEQILGLLLPYYIVSRSVEKIADVRWAICGIVAATAALSSLAIYEASHTWPIYRAVWSHFGVPLTSDASVKLRGGLLRSAGPFPEPTSFGFCLSLGALAAITCRPIFRTPLRWMALTALILVGICAPQSRGAWLGLLVGIVAADILQKRYALLARKIVILTSVGLVVFAAGSINKSVGSLIGLSADGMGSVDYRTTLFHRGVTEIWQHPLLGQDLAHVLLDLHDLVQGEGIVDFVNTYIYICLISGLMGLFVFLIALVLPIVSLWRTRRSSIGRESQWLAAYVFSALVAIAVMLAVTSLGYRSSALLVIAVALAGAINTNSRTRSRSAQSPAPSAPARA